MPECRSAGVPERWSDGVLEISTLQLSCDKVVSKKVTCWPAMQPEVWQVCRPPWAREGPAAVTTWRPCHMPAEKEGALRALWHIRIGQDGLLLAARPDRRPDSSPPAHGGMCLLLLLLLLLLPLLPLPPPPPPPPVVGLAVMWYEM